MAGLTSTFHHNVKCHHLLRPLNPSSSINLRCCFSLRVLSPTAARYPSISTPISARYGGGGGKGGGKGGGSATDGEKALDISSISSDTVRLIDQAQNMVGVVPTVQAIEMADDVKLDLVIISPDADPPVVKIMDYDKYRFEKQKKKRDQLKKNSAGRQLIKELKIGYKIDEHDYSVRLKAAQKFLKEGDKVKIMVRLKGREHRFRQNAIELMGQFRKDIGELAVEEAKNFVDRAMFMLLVPNKAFVQKPQETPQDDDDSAANEVSASGQKPQERPEDNDDSVANEVSASVQKLQEPPKDNDDSVASEVSASVQKHQEPPKDNDDSVANEVSASVVN